ncbi:retron St85 family effector protein [Streptococcus parasanguinis]|uniref:retron St85 family effector protein n=1 Tax=Streptococcus parasanguinis TaxID=1318 RepID=UPI000C7CD80C|nr:retron St85 family effector protein [Streptococcus parasanguinis]PKZ96353.1 hypothetical protein CYK20_08805 [Streptococcus parasanguinis]
MSKYIFKNKEEKNELYKFIFLCGSKYVKSDVSDKRNVLKKHLENINSSYKIIILEENFTFSKSTMYLNYGDIYMRNLYDVEFLVSLLSDVIFIFHESISTGAEAGLFLGEASNREKTCLILPNIEAVEEDKLGNFLKLSFFKGKNPVERIIYYPSVRNNITSVNLRNLHTSFVNDSIGKTLSNNINDFIKGKSRSFEIGKEEFGLNFEEVKLTVRIDPDRVLHYVAAMLSVGEITDKIFGKSMTLESIIEILNKEMNKILISTYEEIKPYKFTDVPEIHYESKKGTIQRMIGMTLYLFSAAGFMRIRKDKTYEEDKKVILEHKGKDKNGKFFFAKYSSLIEVIEEEKIW